MPVASPSSTISLFPRVLGILAFDTPFNGLSRSMFAYGAFAQYRKVSNLWGIVSSMYGMGAVSAATAVSAAAAGNKGNSAAAAVPATTWKRWQTLAMRTGTVGVIAAGGVAAYFERDRIGANLAGLDRKAIARSIPRLNAESIKAGLAYFSRESIGEGFAWISGHLQFVGALMRQQQLRMRLERLTALEGIGIKNLYTTLGENAVWTGGYFVPERTFCALPRKGSKER